MSRGFKKHRARQQALSLFGKELARRCKSQCELCGAANQKLRIFEVSPEPEEPDPDHCVFVCEACSQHIDNPRKLDPSHWRCLATAIWSTIPAVQVAAVRMLDKLGDQDWAQELKEQVYLAPEVRAWIDANKHPEKS